MRTTENVLIVGAGGREHALARKVRSSPRCGKLFVAPGNPGTAQVAANIPIAETDLPALLRFATENDIDLTVIGSEDVLASGVVDLFRAAGKRIFGPTQAAAELETSKAFGKKVMKEAGIGTAPSRTFSRENYAAAIACIERTCTPMMVKASGLAHGKGAHYCSTKEEALHWLKQIMHGQVHGEHNTTVVIEQFLRGDEVSAHAITDGLTYKMFPLAQDHKAIGEGGTGENTGGMGVITPLPWLRSDLHSDVATMAVECVLKQMRLLGRPFTGCLLYPGLMDTPTGLKVIEYNARFGDPETQALMPRLKTDVLDVFDACVDGTLKNLTLEWHEGFAVAITVASAGYPGDYKTGYKITGIQEAENVENVIVFHAGTAMQDGELVTNGGRVLSVTATAPTLEKALFLAYAGVKCIKFEGMYYRTDIGRDALNKLQQMR